MKIAFLLMLTFGYLTGDAIASFVECEKDDDCVAADATCEDNVCECSPGNVLSLDGTKCLEVVLSYGGSCTDDAQCAPLLGKNQCLSGTCQCGTNYRYYHGVCIPAAKLGKFCNDNKNCFVSHDLFAMICSSNRCVCNDGYYERSEYDCRPLAKEINDACAIDSDCQKIPNTYCNNGCVLKPENAERKDINLLKSENKCQEYNVSAPKIIKDTDDCVSNEDCIDKPNSYCSPLTKMCVCKRGYFYNTKNVCVGELGLDVGCESDSECPTSPKVCRDKMCVCPTTHYYGPALNKCVKAAYKVNDKYKCNSDQACNILGTKAKCVTEGSDSYCQCDYGTELNEDFLCVDTTECLAGCSDNEDCEIINSICSRGECVCPDNHRLEDDMCLPNLGATCDEVSRHCIMENSKCDGENKCSCIEGYLQIDSTTCIKRIDEKCTLPQQCILENTECVEGICQCEKGYQEVGGLCTQARSMGDYCTNVLQCHVALKENVLCRNSKCQCASGSQPTEDMLDCITRGSSFGIYQHFDHRLLLSMLLTYYVVRG